ncbi:DUF3971 domain-containing protein [Rhodobacteraceae bacterium]|nr:DUF3971 domain-containing protein [Paracoccaceae bacterium]
MADNADPPGKPSTKVPVRKQRRRAGGGLGTVFSLVVASLVFGVLALSVSGRMITLPDVLRVSFQDRVNVELEGSPLLLGDIQFGIGRDGVPHIMLRDIQIADPQGGGYAHLNTLDADLSLDRLLRGKVAASSLDLSGAQVTIRRNADGSFAFDTSQSSDVETTDLPELLAQIDQMLASDALSSLTNVTANGIVLTLEDARSSRIWQASNATASARRTSDGLSVSLISDVFNGTDDIANVQASVSRSRMTGHVSLGVQVNDMPAADIAIQSPALSWLSVLDTSLSGSLRIDLDETGTLARTSGTFDFAAGALRPTNDTPPVTFESAQTYFTFDPVRQRIDFSQISVKSELGALRATGHSYLSELDGPWPRAFLGQLRVEELSYNGGGVFAAPVSFDDIRADARLRLDPFSVEIAQLVIDNEGVPLRASGQVEARQGRWIATIDAKTKSLQKDRVLELWPLGLAPVTRDWLTENLKDGVVLNPAAGVRFETGGDVDISLSFEFDEARAKFLSELPELTSVAGRATMLDYDFTLSIEEGGVTASTGEWLDASGSVFKVEDTRPKPALAEIVVNAQGPLTAALTVLNNRPLRIMERANRSPDIANATASARAVVRLPLARDIPDDGVTYDVVARLTNVTSDKLVEDRVLSSPDLLVLANQDGISVDGTVRLDGVPLTATWEQPFKEGAKNGGIVKGQVTLSDGTIAAFGVGLPRGLLSGSTEANYTLTLPIDQPSELELTSNLVGLGLSIPSINWRKGRGSSGSLATRVTLNDVPKVEAFSVDAAGLSLDGTLDFSANGFRRARFSKARIGNWLNSSVTLTPGANGTAIGINGGTFDLRRFESGSGSSGGSSSRDAGTIEINLDRLIVTDSIALGAVRGQLRRGAGGLRGEFEARVNNGTPIKGQLTPANGGTAVRISSNNAAGVIRDAGLTENGQFGELELDLTPVSGAPAGNYDGRFNIKDMRIRNAPLMADLLDAISVIGVLDQLNGPGIKFSNIDGRFRLTPQRLQLLQAAAVGPSIGISGDGFYNLASKQLDFRGVISPVYFLNGIGSIFTRRGEGLFGFNYRVSGGANNPKIAVNPLSILTPGMFREIFRSAPPQG